MTITPVLIFIYVMAFQAPQQPDLSSAIALYDRGEFAQAAEQLARQCPDQQDCGEGRIWLGRSYLKMRRWDNAIRELKIMVEKSPSNSTVRHWLGRAYGEKAAHSSFFAALGPAQKVCDEFENAQRLEPDNLEIRFDLLSFYLQAPGFIGGGRDKALAQVAAIEKLNKRAGQTARARVLEHDKKWPEAGNQLTQSTLDFPDDPDAFGELAEYLYKRGEYRGAEAAATKALALRSWYPMALWVKAASQAQRRERLEDAEAVLMRLTGGPLGEQDPDFEDIYYWLGMVRLARGKTTEGRDALQTALRFDPEHKAARSALSQLKSK